MGRDLHHALKLDKLAQQQIQGAEFTLVRRQDGKEDVVHGLHARVTDNVVGLLLAHLGFRKGPCQFTPDDQCFSKELDPDTGMEAFVEAFTKALAAFREATQKIGGFLDPGPRLRPAGFDGHRAPESKFLKGKDEGAFRFVLSWTNSKQGTGWVRHFRVRDTLPYDAEHLITSVLNLESFDSCPHFDFEPCFWTFTPQRQLNPVAAQMIHETFDKFPSTFPAGLAALAAAEEAMRPTGMQFPPALVPTLKRFAKFADAVGKSQKQATSTTRRDGHEFDVALSFAGSERPQAEQLATAIRGAGFTVFYDDFYPDVLWGKDLTIFFDDVYRKKARFCVLFVSEQYRDRMWTAFELKSARARALQEKEKEYILPITVEPVDLPGLAPTIAHLDLKKLSLSDIAQILVKKLQATRS